ncbi:MAG: DUF6906 family protein [Ruminiclostridium sp.]
MKHGKRLTVKQKDILKSLGINSDKYLRVKNLPNELHFVHIKTNKLRTFIKREDGNWYESNRNS